ncbi:MAG: preprotein translocase subunit SecY [Phycisphaerales bacterium]
MFQALINVFKITELRTKILFTLGMLAVFRIGHWIPLPGVDQTALVDHFNQAYSDQSAASRVANFVAIFSGGDFGRSTIFGLGIMPYISASIIFQLLASVWKTLKDLQNEGPTGRQKIMEWTRYATVGLCLLQSFMWLKYITAHGLVFTQWASHPIWWLTAIGTLTAGTLFLMWLGEQIDKYGIGNGVSLIIMAGILARMPEALLWVANNSPIRTLWITRQVLGPAENGFNPTVQWMGVLMLLAGFIMVIAGAILLTVAQRRIPIQQAKHTRGRKVFGGQKSYLPLRVNHGGVMPVIFASTLMIFPSVIFGAIDQSINSGGSSRVWYGSVAQWLAQNFQIGEFPYVIAEFTLIFFFSYMWITIQFNPEEMSKQLRDHGSFIPGLRPGPRTAEYLETVMERITFVGAAMLGVIAILPVVVNKSLGVSFAVTQFLGGTGLLIVVSVGLDFIQRVEANLLMRNYAGFLGGSDEGGSRIRGPRSF